MFALATAACVVTFLAQQQSNQVATFQKYSLEQRLGNACVSYVLYIGKTIWPARLALFYPHRGAALPAVEAWARRAAGARHDPGNSVRAGTATWPSAGSGTWGRWCR